MVYPVEKLDYPVLVESLAKAGLNGMADVVAEQLGKLGKPVWANEITFFWRSLYNAARVNDMVWLWLVTQPYSRNFAPLGAKHFTMPGLAPEANLPLIGGLDDTPYVPGEQPRQWPADPTEGNLHEQALALDDYMRTEAGDHPDNRCKCVDDYVATFYYSGSGQMMARTQLIEFGFHALATQEGLRYLMETYPPELERKKYWFVKKTVMALVEKEFPFAKVTGQHIEVKAPEIEDEFDATRRLWVTVFQKLYAANEVIQTLPIVSFWHQLPDEAAPIGHYTKREGFFRRHPRLANLCRVTVAEKTVKGEMIEIEVHDVALLFADPEKLNVGAVSFCLTPEERNRILKPGLQGVFIWLPIKHPFKLSIAAGSIHRIMLP